MKEKILNAIVDMKSKVERDSKHVYRNPETGDMYQGVSTVSSIIPKDWLMAFGAKEVVKALGYTDYSDTKLAEETLSKIKNLNLKEYLALLKEVKGAPSKKGKNAMKLGTDGHSWIQKYIESRINDSTRLELPDTEELKRPLQEFLDWESLEVDYWIISEAYVVYPDKMYAGQLDAIYMSKKGELTLCDFKFATFLSAEYNLQCAGYAYCFEPYGINFDKRVIIRLPKTLEREEWNEKEYKYEKVPNNIEVCTVSSDYKRDCDTFLAALVVKSWINKYNK